MTNRLDANTAPTMTPTEGLFLESEPWGKRSVGRNEGPSFVLVSAMVSGIVAVTVDIMGGGADGVAERISIDDVAVNEMVVKIDTAGTVLVTVEVSGKTVVVVAVL